MESDPAKPNNDAADEETLDPRDWDEIRSLGHRMLDEMLDYLSTVREKPAWQAVPEKFTKVLLEGRLSEGMLIKAMAGDTPILLYKKGDTVCAISETCSHAGGPLSEGELDGNLVQCPWHASRFDICTGQVRGGPATISQVRYETRIQNGQIEVRRSEDTLQPN